MSGYVTFEERLDVVHRCVDLGEDVQAASIAYGYYKAEFNSMIDAFIIRSMYDHAGEAAQGLSMGLSSASGKHRQAYTVFKYKKWNSHNIVYYLMFVPFL